ncbi:hypothetical protein, unlikely [Trypanosoma brucei gambiense DAL972]|uniref:Uncharacterized protein n=1 Tax=Trypanosoma brucei gambiense (strain MHOM/CI/86/DAL972) TaxID=679716 RepID=D0A909_TRYB9|nr:hypothetical protein, unlikely [Trypanosoma brucei gambiense DAL972]CBH18160.1 hypothetical protein, unlikely [Trypanosoma brucei gambiense DAL972]|eukprot:XP_011780424.1 hypothetical protein, unlikely [Trypanosoma brucei gambiense DAL972]
MVPAKRWMTGIKLRYHCGTSRGEIKLVLPYPSQNSLDPPRWDDPICIPWDVIPNWHSFCISPLQDRSRGRLSSSFKISVDRSSPFSEKKQNSSCRQGSVLSRLDWERTC